MSAPVHVCFCVCVSVDLSPFFFLNHLISVAQREWLIAVWILQTPLCVFSMEHVEPSCCDCSLGLVWRELRQKTKSFVHHLQNWRQDIQKFYCTFWNCFSWATCPWGLIFLEPQKILAAVVLHVAKTKQKQNQTKQTKKKQNKTIKLSCFEPQ